MKYSYSALFSFALIFSLLAPSAWAESDTPVTGESANELGAIASDSDLSISRGTDNVTSTNNLGASLYGNSALNTVTGGNFVTDGALANSSGFSTVVQNSGNNVLIQSALILNLNVQ